MEGTTLSYATGPAGPPGWGVGVGNTSGVGIPAGGISGGRGCVLPGVGGVAGMSGWGSGLSGIARSSRILKGNARRTRRAFPTE